VQNLTLCLRRRRQVAIAFFSSGVVVKKKMMAMCCRLFLWRWYCREEKGGDNNYRHPLLGGCCREEGDIHYCHLLLWRVLQRRKRRQLLSPFSRGDVTEKMKVTTITIVVAFFFVFLCGDVATTKVVSPFSLCLRRRRRQ